jgi:hypothetical protein
MPVLTGGQVLDREGTTVMPDWGGALLEGGLYNVGDHGLIEEAEEPVMGMGPYKYSGVPPNGYKNGIAEKGAYLVDILTGDTYRNTGTKAATAWTADASSGGGSGLPMLVFVDGLGGLLNDTNPHNFALDLGAAAVVEGDWTVDGDGNLVAPVAGLYECVFSVQMQRHATEESLVTCAINSATSDTELGPVLVQAPASADSSAIDLDARTFTSGVTAGQSFGTLQLTQTNAAATGRNVFARLTIRCLALA